MSAGDDTRRLAHSLSLLAAWRTVHRLTAHLAEVLIQVHTAGAITAAEVCRVMGLTTASMTRIVGHLEAGDWLLRVRDDHDARRLILQPTKKLARAIDELDHSIEAARRLEGEPEGELDAC